MGSNPIGVIRAGFSQTIDPGLYHTKEQKESREFSMFSRVVVTAALSISLHLEFIGRYSSVAVFGLIQLAYCIHLVIV